MHKKRNILFSIFLIVIVAILTIFLIDNIVWKEISIDLSPDYNELISEEQMKEKGHFFELSQYATDVSIAYENEDGTKTLYVYSAPIRFLNSSGQYSMIDTRIANVRDVAMREKGYIYTIANSDIKSFFPRELNENTGIIVKNDIEFEFGVYDEKSKGWYREFKNFVSENKRGVHYYDCFNSKATLSSYPTHLGTNCEIKLEKDIKCNELSFWLRVDDSNIKIKKEPGGYITINKNNIDEDGNITSKILSVIQKPLMKSATGEISDDSSIELFPEGNGVYKLVFNINENFCKKDSEIFIAFEMRREKQPDNAIYSRLPDLKYAYLRNYSVIGNSEEYGIGRLLIRYKFVKYFNLKPLNIKSAYYNVFCMDINNEKFELLSVLEDWCSITGNWNNHYKTGHMITATSGNDNTLSFDITSEVIKWASDPSGQMEHNGLLLKQQNEGIEKSSVFLSNDNTLYRNFTEVTLK